MLLSLLSPSVFAFIALGTTGVPDHAAHHPAAVDIYLDAPDVQAFLQSYGDAPLVKMLGDEATSKIGEVTSAMGWDLKTIFDGALPQADSKHANDRFWPWSALTHASASVAGLGAGPATNATGATRFNAWIVLDFKDSAAAAQALAAMSSIGGITKIAIKGDEKLAYSGHDLVPERFELATGTPHTPLWFAQSDARLIGGIGAAEPGELADRMTKPETSFIGKAKQLADDSGFSPASGVTILRAWSELERISFSDDKENALLSGIANEVLPEILPFVGSKGRWRLQLRKDRFVSESAYTRIGPAKQLDAFFGEGSISPSVARLVPKDAIGVWIAKVKPERIEQDLEKLLASAPGSPPDSAAAAPAANAPKLASTMGDTAASFLMPIPVTNISAMAGGTPQLPIDIGLAIEIKDAAACQKALEGWIERAKKADPRLVVEAKPFHKMPMYNFSYAPEKSSAGTDDKPDATSPVPSRGGLESMIRPSITVLPDRLLVTSGRTLGHKEIQRFESKSTEGHAITAEGRIPKDAFEASTMDWGGMLGKLYDGARSFLPMALQNTEKHVDVNALPTAAQLFRFFQPSFSYSKNVGGRIYTYSESSFGPETPLALGGLGYLVSARATQGGMSSTGPRASATKPSSPQPNAGEKTDAKDATKAAPVDSKSSSTTPIDAAQKSTLAALRAVKVGLAVYKGESAHYPTTLEDLVKSSANFPRGYLEGEPLPKDGWGHDLVYAAQENGAKYKLWSCGPDGLDQKGAGDDVSAP